MASPAASPQTRESIAFLTSAAAQLAAVRDLESLADTLHRIIMQLVEVEYSGIYFLDPESATLRLFSAQGFDEEERKAAEKTAMERHPGAVMRTGRRIHVPDLAEDAEHLTTDSLRKGKVRSRLFLPIISEGRPVGTFGMASSQANRFDDLHVAVLEFAGQLAGVVYKNICDSSELHRQLNRVRQQELDLRRLSSPVIEVWNRVLVLPLIGDLSQQRFEIITENLLNAVVKKRAQSVIVDLTGVELLDESATLRVVRLCGALALLGSRCLLSGISTGIALSLSRASADLSQLSTFGTLQQALAFSIHSVG